MISFNFRPLGTLLFMCLLLLVSMTGCDTVAVTDDTPETLHADSVTAAAGKRNPSADLRTIKIPEAPRKISAESVERDLDHTGENMHHVMHDPEALIEDLSKVRTRSQVEMIAAMAARAITMLPEEKQPHWQTQLNRTMGIALARTMLVARPPEPHQGELDLIYEPRHTGVYNLCFVSFSSYEVLSNIPDEGASTFLFAPFWRQDCGDDVEIRVEPLVDNHFHVMPEDPSMDCYNGVGFGQRNDDFECISPPDYADEPRFLGTMGGYEIIRIQAHDTGTGQVVPFDMPSFANVGTIPVKFRYKMQNGDWFQWDYLGGSTNWGVSVYNTTEVQITHYETSTSCLGDADDWFGTDTDCPTGIGIFELDTFVIGH